MNNATANHNCPIDRLCLICWPPPAPTSAELLRLLERHHKESIVDDRFLRKGTEHYVGTELYLETEAAIKHAKEAV